MESELGRGGHARKTNHVTRQHSESHDARLPSQEEVSLGQWCNQSAYVVMPNEGWASDLGEPPGWQRLPKDRRAPTWTLPISQSPSLPLAGSELYPFVIMKQTRMVRTALS